MDNEIKILNNKLFEIDVDDYQFIIQYDFSLDVWSAIKEDEIEDTIIIEDKKNNIFYVDNLELFKGFILNKYEFEEMKKIKDDYIK